MISFQYSFQSAPDVKTEAHGIAPAGTTFRVGRIALYLICLIFGLFLLTSGRLSAQSPDYPAIFGDDWKKAGQFLNDNRSWMEPVLRRNHIPYPIAIAVIFPELVRYSALRDKMEITLLKALYINLGDQYADFSVGQFQMKPSFAHLIREQGNFVLTRRSGIRFARQEEFENTGEYRKSIIEDLEDPVKEFNYLVAFILICDKNFRTNHMDDIQRLTFLATAYNYGVDKSSEEIEKMAGRKFFNTKLFRTENYSYADVSLCWYKEFISSRDKVSGH